MVDVVGELCGVQAQVMPNAELAIGLRVAGVTRRDVRDALWERRSLVKTYGVRGTIHLYPASELGLWLAALRATPAPNRSRVLEATDTSPERFAELVAAIGDALDGRQLSREELGDTLVDRMGSWAGDEVVPAFASMWPRWTIGLDVAAAEGLLCFGPNRGNRVTFVRPDQWLDGVERVDGAYALAEVFRRYLRTYGPATSRDFAQWFNMEPSAAAGVARSLAGDVTEVDVEGDRLLQLAPGPDAEPAPDAKRRGSFRLLAPFDVYLIGSFPRDRLIPDGLLDRLGHERVPASWARRALSGGSVANIPVLLRDGVVGGVWERRRSGRGRSIRVEPFTPVSAAARTRIEAEARRVGEILEADVSFELGTVDVRPHL